MQPSEKSPIGLFVVITVASITFFSGLGSARLWDRDEPRNAQCAAEMFERGDWIVPTFAGGLRTHKPVLLYWLQMSAYSAVGVNEWGARIPSAACGLLTVAFCYSIALQLLGRTAANWAGLVLSTSTMFVIASRAATPDAVLMACTTLAIWLFVRDAFRPNPAEHAISFLRLSSWQWCSVYGACGLAVLAKGPVGFVLPACVIGLVLVWANWQVPIPARMSLQGITSWLGYAIRNVGLTAWEMRPFTAVAVIACIAGPWYLAVGMMTDGAWLREFFWTHNVSRATSAMEGHTGPPFVYYLGALAVGTFPWSIWLFTSWLYAKQVWSTQPSFRPAIVLATAWIVVYIGCFSLAATKLPSYITPCYPGAALLYALLLSSWSEQRKHFLGWARIGLGIAVVAGISIAIAAGVVKIGDIDFVVLVPTGLLFLVTSLFAANCMSRGNPAMGVRMYAIGAVGMILGLAILGPVIADRSRGDLDFLGRLKSVESPMVAYVGEAEPSWVFYGSKVSKSLSIVNWQTSALGFLSALPHRALLLDRDQIRSLEESMSSIATEARFRVGPAIVSGTNDRVVYLVELQDRSGAVAERLATPLLR